MNFFDLCAISVPMPRDGGLPTGLMLIARNGQDSSVPHRSGGRAAICGVSPDGLFCLSTATEIRHHAANGPNQQPTGRKTMNRKSHSATRRVTRRTFTAGLGAGISPDRPVQYRPCAGRGAQSRRAAAAFRLQAGIGQDCQRGVDIAAGILKDSACPRSRS